jgi:sugar O-acyltransferase (sialic acid O-acetyltransferase NeuD family)
MRKIGIVGYGELGKQIHGLLAATGPVDHVALFDDLLYRQNAANVFPFEAFLEDRFADLEFYVGLGYRHLPRKAEVLRVLLAAGRRTPSFVHPSCQVHPTCRRGEGCVIYPLCNLGQEVELGHGVLLNNSVVVSHNSRLADCVYCSPGVVLSGYVVVGEASFLGSGTIVSNNRSIGARAQVGIGSVVTMDIPNGASAIGNPLRLLNKPLNVE